MIDEAFPTGGPLKEIVDGTLECILWASRWILKLKKVFFSSIIHIKG